MKGTKITHDEKETALEALREHGTMQYAAKISGVAVRTLNLEMTRSAVFKRRVLEAREEGKRNIADKAIDLIKSYAYGQNPDGKEGELAKTDRNRLTAAIALANAYEPGFRGVTTIQGRVVHEVPVLTAVPRPKYEEIIDGEVVKLPPGGEGGREQIPETLVLTSPEIEGPQTGSAVMP